VNPKFLLLGLSCDEEQLCDQLLGEWNAFVPNSDVLAPVQPLTSATGLIESEDAFLARASRTYQAREAALLECIATKRRT